MDCCKHCNFRNTDKCDLYEISERLEYGEIDHDQAQIEYESALMKCEDKYFDHQLMEAGQ